MLALDSPQWSELHPFFDAPEDVPRVIADWLQSIGSDQEELVYSRDLFHLFLHQNTNSDVAYAVVPWLVEAASNRQSPQAIQYIADVATVEWNRLEFGTYYPKGGPDEAPPDWLAADYHDAIQAARALAEDLVESETQNDWWHQLWCMMPALWGNSKLASRRWHNVEQPPSE